MKIGNRNYSDEIVKKYTRQEFIAIYGAKCKGCGNLGKVYDELVRKTGLIPKQGKPKDDKAKK